MLALRDRLAIPVAADDDAARQVGISLLHDMGFDGYDAGSLTDSWRQQPGSFCCCTDLTAAVMPKASAAAERDRLPKRRDLAIAVVQERLGSWTKNPDAEYLVRLSRALCR